MNKELLQRIVDGRTDLVLDLIESGGNPSTHYGGTALIRWCAYYGDVSAVRLLLGRGAALGSLGDNLDLNGAAFHGHWRLCQFLLEQGADPNHALQNTGETPLHAAVCKADRPAYDHVLRVLLASGATPNAKTLPGEPTGSFMRDARTKGETPLHRAAAFAGETAIELLLAAGADKKATDIVGDSPLSWASWHLRPASILTMLSYGEHSLHSDHIKRLRSDHGRGWGNGIEVSLLGTPHT